MREETNVGARVFAREVRFGADDEVRGSEVVQGGEDLGRVEGGVQRDQYRSKLEQSIRRLVSSSAPCSISIALRRTVANSTLFPSDTATLSPLRTPSFCSPLASLFESRSSASYVRVVRWWCDITLLRHQSRCLRVGTCFIRVKVAVLADDTRKVLRYRLLEQRRL
jgi:hypothetical protein